MSQVASPSVYVGNLDKQVTEQDLYDHFGQVGAVMSTRVCLDVTSGRSMGYGYVNFQNAADAEKALDLLGTRIREFPSYIRVARIQRDPSQRRSGITNIIVKKLPKEFDVPDLKQMFSKFGRLVSIHVVKVDGADARWYSHISFETEDAATQAAAEMNGMEVDEHPIVVERYQPRHVPEQIQNFTNLYVKNLGQVSKDQLDQYFGKFGELTSTAVRDVPKEQNVCFAYVAYANHDDAVKAVDADHSDSGLAAPGRSLEVKRFETHQERQRKRERSRRQRQIEHSQYPNLYVKNFDGSVTSEHLKNLIESRHGDGSTISCRVMMDDRTGTSRCFGFVSVKSKDIAHRVIQELHNSTFLGDRPLYVTHALRKDARRQALDEIHNKQRQTNPAAMRSRPMGNMGMGNMYPPMMHNQMFSSGMPMGQMPPQRPMMPTMGSMNPGMGAMGPGAGLRPAFPPMGLNPALRRPPPTAAMPRPMMPQAPMQQPIAAPQPQGGNLAHLLSTMNPEQQKNVLGERLYTYILRRHPQEAAKVTGMLLEMDNAEIISFLENTDNLDNKIAEALDVLRRHGAGLN